MQPCTGKYALRNTTLCAERGWGIKSPTTDCFVQKIICPTIICPTVCQKIISPTNEESYISYEFLEDYMSYWPKDYISYYGSLVGNWLECKFEA